MQNESSSRIQRNRTYWFVFAGLGFFPMIGIPFGIAALLRGIITRKTHGKALMIVSLFSFLPMGLIYGSLFYLKKNEDGIVSKLNVSLNSRILAQSVGDIEVHKISFGAYPDDVGNIKNRLNIRFIQNSDGTLQQGFYYEKTKDGKRYILGNVGKDAIKGTADDIVPIMQDTTSLGILNAKIGDID